MKKLIPSFLITFLAGCIYALAYPSFLGNGWLPLIFIAIPLFLWKLEEASFKGSLLLIFGFNLGLNVTGYYWIPHTLREFGQLPYIVSLLLGAGFSLILQPHWWVYAVWKKFRPVKWDWSSEKNIVLTALIMTILERYVQQQFPSYAGSPWLHLAPYLSLVPYFGVAAFSFMTYWLSLEMIAQLKAKRFRVQVWAAMGIFVLINALFPLKNPASGMNLPVRVVQANIGNFLKVSSERGDVDSYQTISETYERLSKEDNGFKPHLIIWPETAYPDTFYGTETQLNEIFRNIFADTESEILVGGYDQDMTKSPDDIESVFNASLLLSENKVKSIYHKNILIPFGETLPFGPLNRTVVEIVPAISLFARGDGIPVMETRGGYRFVTPICYEILESDYMRGLLNQWGHNHFIVNHTNDSWYGNTAEPLQHLFLSKWRALEFQLPIIRSTNTGITSVIFQDGTESRRLGIGEVGRLDVTLPLGQPLATVYQQYGVLPLLLLAGLMYLVTWVRERNANN